MLFFQLLKTIVPSPEMYEAWHSCSPPACVPSSTDELRLVDCNQQRGCRLQLRRVMHFVYFVGEMLHFVHFVGEMLHFVYFVGDMLLFQVVNFVGEMLPFVRFVGEMLPFVHFVGEMLLFVHFVGVPAPRQTCD